MRDCNAEIYAAEHKDDRCKRRKYKVDFEERHGHITQPRHDAIHRRSCALGVIHIDCTCTGLREERDEDDDDAKEDEEDDEE